MKYLIMTRNGFPFDRSDVKVLFGEELSRRGHHIDWIAPSAQPRRSRGTIRYASGQVWLSARAAGDSPVGKALRLLQELRNDLEVVRRVRDGGYDFVQVKDRFIGGVLALAAARLNGLPLVFWLAYPFPEAWLYEARAGVARFPLFSWLRGGLSKWLLYRIILPRADCVFVQSEQMLEDVAREGIDRGKLCAVPMGVSAEYLAAASPDERVRRPIVLYVGTMIRVRRLDFVLRAFVRVLEQIPDAELVMVGGESGDDLEGLRALAARLGIAGSVRFTGRVPQHEAIEWIRTARVGVSPFYPTPILSSTSPTKLVEYLSQGTAVVATDHPEQSRVIEASGGGFCVPYDEAPFAEAIVRLLREPELAAAMGARGRSYVQAERSYPVIAERLDARYRALLIGGARAHVRAG